MLFLLYMVLLTNSQQNSTFHSSENKMFVTRVIYDAEYESGTEKAYRARVLNFGLAVYLFGSVCTQHSIPPLYDIAGYPISIYAIYLHKLKY